jgi:hypothetical protein
VTDQDDIDAQIAAASETIGRLAATTNFPTGQASAERIAATVKAAGFGPVPERVEVTYAVAPAKCHVYWGSHGCQNPRGHGPEIPHECNCCECKNHPDDLSCVAKPPYYGPETLFYGEDAEMLGLPGALDV